MRSAYNNKLPLLGADNNGLVLLIAINGLVFVLLNFIRLIYAISFDTQLIAESFFQKQILNWFQLPTTFDTFATRPWTLFTYAFSHYGVLHLIGNMLWIWGFGFILQDLAGNNKLIPIYLYGGVVGGLVFVTAVNFVPFLYNNLANIAPLIGAGAAIMAVAVATTTLAPDYRIFPMINGGIPLWVLTLVFVAFDFASIASQNGGIGLAHLAAGAVGFIFIKQLKKGNDWSAWMVNFVNWLNNLFNPEKQLKNTIANRQFYESKQPPFTKISNVNQQKLDVILDKINQEGYHMLTDEEKAFLQRAKDEL